MDAWQSYPFGLAVAFLFLVAMLRGQATYWVARTITEQTLRRTSPMRGWRARVHTWLNSTTMDRGREAVSRYGILAVPLCYVTVGVQTVVLASAGVLRMRWLRFTLAQSVGALAWGLIYSTIGFAFWAAFLEIAFTGWVGAVVAAAVLAVTVAIIYRCYVVRRRRRVGRVDPGLRGTDAEVRDRPATPPCSSAPDPPGSNPLTPRAPVDDDQHGIHR